MIKNLFTISAIIGANLINAQTVGDASLGTYNFNNNQLLNTGAISHYAPMVFVEDGESTVVWAGGTSPNTGIYHTKLNSSTYISVGTVDTVVAYTGVLNSDGDGLSHQVDFESTTNKFLDIYRFADNLGPVFKDFSLKGKLFLSNDFTATEIVIEGPMDYANQLPFWWRVCNGPTGKFGIIYHSDGGSSTASKIVFKTVDATTGTVTPSSQPNLQTGLQISMVGATFADIAFNSTAGVYGIVFITGTGNNTKIKFVSVDAAGVVVTSEKDVIANNAYLSTQPRIEADGDGFVIVWTDFRPFQIPNQTLQSGKPMSRIAQLTSTGDLVANTGAAPFFEAADKSLILSNPYQHEVYTLRQELVVVTPREKYGVIYTTQNAPYETYFVEAQVSPAGVMNSMIPVLVSNPTLTTDQPSIAYDVANSNYVLAYQQYTGNSYENRISSSTYSMAGIDEKAVILNSYPNPVNDNLTISSSKEIGAYKIINTLGQVIMFGEINDTKMTINLELLLPGVYFFATANANSRFIKD